jgi:two-component system sensor histidine kinase AlgZ
MPPSVLATKTRQRVEHSPLPDFCRLPALSAIIVVGALTVTIVWLARNGERDWSGYCVGMLFVTWMSLVLAVTLCKLRPVLQRLPGRAPYFGVWLLILLTVLVTSGIARWLDIALQMHLGTREISVFMRDNVAIAALLGAAMLRYFYVLAQWQLRLSAVARAQVDALQARIRPHFLFNSMNTVAALIRVDPDAAERTVENLSELFRAALGQHDNDNGTLGDELELLERYLAIEQLRLGGRLRVHRDLDMLPPNFSLPRLLLQPLVENAVRHGIQPLIGGGQVVLRGRRERGGGIRIEIINPLPATPPEPGNGHALDNVRQRIAYRYGPDARVEAGREVTVEGEHYVVRLHLPSQDSDANSDR